MAKIKEYKANFINFFWHFIMLTFFFNSFDLGFDYELKKISQDVLHISHLVRWNLCEEPIFYWYGQIYVISIDALKAGNVFH